MLKESHATEHHSILNSFVWKKKALVIFDKLQILQELLKWTEFPSVLHSLQSYYGIDLGF